MTSVQLLLTDNYGAKAKHFVELYDVEPIKLSYQVKDLTDISKRSAAFSKTIKLPGTSLNAQIFTNIFEINNTITYNPAKKATCALLADSVPVIEGFFALTAINILDSGEVEYEGVILGQYIDIVKTIGDKYLWGNDDTAQDLTFTELAHDVRTTSVTDSWTGNADSPGYVYPMIEMGQGWSNTTLNAAVPIEPFVNTYPSLYAKTIIDKIFEQSGFQYKSNFFNSAFFKKLYVPGYVNSSDIPNLGVRAYPNGYGAGSGTFVTYNSNDYLAFDDTALEFDPNGYFGQDPGTGIWSFAPPQDGWYNIDLTVDVTTSGGHPGGGAFLEVYFYVVETTGPGFYAYKKGKSVVEELKQAFPSSSLYSPALQNRATYKLYAGKKYGIVGKIMSSGAAPYNTYDIHADATKLEIFDSEHISDLNISLPKQVKQADFLRSILMMFNCIVEPSKDDPRVLNIEPREDYYSAGVAKDWSKKLDRASNYNLTLLSEVSSKQYHFSYTEDTDTLNEDYTSRTKHVYGEYNHLVDNDFLTGAQEIKPIFAPTIVKPVPGYTNMVIPYITPKDSTDISNLKPRILIHGGAKTISGGATVQVRTGLTTVTVGNYDYSGHYEVPFIPDGAVPNPIDLNFGPVSTYYSQTGTEFANNLFNYYYGKEMTDISSPESKLLKAKFYLTTHDIYAMRFNDKIYLEVENSPSWWRLSKVLDFDPTVEQLTTVELIKIDNSYNALVKASTKNVIDIGGTYGSGTTNGDSGSGGQQAGAPFSQVSGTQNFVASSTEYSQVRGDSNSVAIGALSTSVFGNSNVIKSNSTGCSVVGNSNTVGTGCSNIKIQGNGNTVNNSLTNVVIMGNGITATVSNKIYTTTLDATTLKQGGVALNISQWDLCVPLVTSQPFDISTASQLTIPKMATAVRLALTAVAGMIVYDTGDDAFYKYRGGGVGWVTF
jgi:hypothetical protein